MDKLDKFVVQSVINIFRVERGMLQILLFQNSKEPYSGYWMLPNNLLDEKQTIEESGKETLNIFLGYSDIYLEQSCVFKNYDSVSHDNTISISFIGLTDSVVEKNKFHISKEWKYRWVSIDDALKMIPNHSEILSNTLNVLKKKIESPLILKTLYPGEFTLPEVQKMLESLLNISLDRRNFRKRLLNKGWIVETGNNSEGAHGRPGKLYKFCDDIKEDKFY